ncbi:MAG TPA: NAD(P)H-dependent glycerol-3-phosphate dehydrogenase [Longimicrobiales bacterium]|nr:NAD(P)H-dependent glycerol-3-phosphate dehydrogenase [Longimicrobiales bacterium]
MTPVAVIGAGSWGTTLADLLARKGNPVRLWSYEPEVAREINESRHNSKYLRGIRLAEQITAVTDLRHAVTGAGVVISVSPAQHVRRIMAGAAQWLDPESLVISASKGIEIGTLDTMADVLNEVLPARAAATSCYLSGPSFAMEVAQGKPTAVAIASRDDAAARRAQELLQTDYFRVYTNSDVRGVEIAGALKNVIALAAGMAVGLELGYNAMAALITRGLAEIARLGVALGARPLTFAGLAGLGDLLLTCTGELSRNRSVGAAIGRGQTLEQATAGMAAVVEGVDTTRAARALAERTGIEMPIVEEVYGVLFQGRSPREAVENLMLREPKAEWLDE